MNQNRLAPITETAAWQRLTQHAVRIASADHHLRRLLKHPGRFSDMSLTTAGLLFDYSRQRVDNDIVKDLLDLAHSRQVTQQFTAMCNGQIVNHTEHRAALHTACRQMDGRTIIHNDQDVTQSLQTVRRQIKTFCDRVHSGDLRGASGLNFEDVVVIGIGGSHLGAEFVWEALQGCHAPRLNLHFLSNVDIHSFRRIKSRIDPATTLWVVISKSYSTPETAANEALARAFTKAQGLDPQHHFVIVTGADSPGDRPMADNLGVFHMFDFIGGRFSVTSAVGGLPLGLALGYETYERFLKGAHAMDQHAQSARDGTNIPLMAALLTIWNSNFLNYTAQAIIPYASPLNRLAAHVQQLNMESNGKSVSQSGQPLAFTAGPIIFGEPGTNAQHSFFQLAHQGRPFPIEFIGVVRPQGDADLGTFKGVTNHQELWANLLAQPMALAVGEQSDDPARQFNGNRPSSTILIDDLGPESVGRLLAFYEHKTVYEAFLWGINPFDQFGVELGKKLAGSIRSRISQPGPPSGQSDPITAPYLAILKNGRIGGD